MKVYEAVAKAVAAEGIELLFTFMDSSTIELVQALHEEGIRVYHTRHEQGAVMMADGICPGRRRSWGCARWERGQRWPRRERGL